MSDRMIKADDQTHTRLAELATEQVATIGGLVGEPAAGRPTRADSDAFLAAVEARFGQPDAGALDRVNKLLDQNGTGPGKKPAA